LIWTAPALIITGLVQELHVSHLRRPSSGFEALSAAVFVLIRIVPYGILRLISPDESFRELRKQEMVNWQSPEVIARSSFILSQETLFVMGFYSLVAIGLLQD
jgi:hypothetical protein